MFELFAGYALDPFLSLDFGLNTIGSVTADDAGVTTKLFDTTSMYATALMYYRTPTRVQLYAGLGFWYWTLSGRGSSELDSDVGLVYGLGADINIYGAVERVMRVKLTRHEGNRAFFNNVDSLSISLVQRY